jgi:hypothetical protein
MRVQYTLPGLHPGFEQSATISAKPASMAKANFRSHMRRLSAAIPTSWRTLLHLDQSPRNAGHLAAPPRPDSLDVRDVATERIRWRGMLDRQARNVTHMAQGTSNEQVRSVERMLAVLMRLQDLEDAVISRHLSETKG